MRVKYFVDKEKGVVVCVGQDCMFDLIREVGATDELFSPLLLSDLYKGIARLQDGDVWDEDYGKKLAYAKMIKKYVNAKQKKLNALIKDTEEVSEFLKHLSENYARECMRANQAFDFHW